MEVIADYGSQLNITIFGVIILLVISLGNCERLSLFSFLTQFERVYPPTSTLTHSGTAFFFSGKKVTAPQVCECPYGHGFIFLSVCENQVHE